MFRKLKKDEIPVMLQFTNLPEYGWNYFKLDNKEYTIFPNEQEVLLYTGLLFEIKYICDEELENGKKYYLIILE